MYALVMTERLKLLYLSLKYAKGNMMNKFLKLFILIACLVSLTGCYDMNAIRIMNELTVYEWMYNHTILYNAQTNTYIATVASNTGKIVGGYIKMGGEVITYGGGTWYANQRDVIIYESTRNSGFTKITIAEVPSNVVIYVAQLLTTNGFRLINVPLFFLPGTFSNPFGTQKTFKLYTVG